MKSIFSLRKLNKVKGKTGKSCIREKEKEKGEKVEEKESEKLK